MNIDTHRFRTGEICDGLDGIYKAVRHLLNTSDDTLHQQTVNYYFNHKKNDEYGWCKDAQRRTLAILHNVMICVIDLKQNEKNQAIVTIKFYWENSSLEKKCIYMCYDETTFNYYPLSVTNNENLNEKMTKINYDDIVKELIRIYIKDEIKYEGKIDFDDIDLNNALAPLDHEKANGHETIPDSIVMDPSTKRKLVADIDGILPPLNDNRQLPIDNPDEMPNKRPKVIEDPTDRITTIYKHKFETKTMEGLIQGDRTHDESDTDDTHEHEQSDLPMVLENEHLEGKAPTNQCGEDI